MKRFLIVGILLINILFAQKKVFIAEGMSAPGQSPRAAYIAAKLDAQRQLLEQIGKVKIDSSTTVKDGMLKDDYIRSAVNGVLKGAKVVKSVYYPDKGYAVVTMAINYNKLAAEIVKHKKFKNVLNIPYDFKNKKNFNQETKMCDGLIIDVRGKNFEPAIVNKILYKDKIIYDPSKVPQSVIIQRGLASYTTTINKAKAILDSYGSNSPCVVVPLKVIKSTDVELDKKEVDMIVKSDVQNAFLEKARIVFVLDNE